MMGHKKRNPSSLPLCTHALLAEKHKFEDSSILDAREGLKKDKKKKGKLLLSHQNHNPSRLRSTDINNLMHNIAEHPEAIKGRDATKDL